MVFGEISFEVDYSKFDEWATQTKARFPKMVETMRNVARIIELRTLPLVPLDTSALEQSFDYKIVNSSNFILLGMGYSAVDEDSGFQYAYYQHYYDLKHPKRGEQKYFEKGIWNSEVEWLEIIEDDYMSLFFDSSPQFGSIGKNNEMSKHIYKTVYMRYEWSK